MISLQKTHMSLVTWERELGNGSTFNRCNEDLVFSAILRLSKSSVLREYGVLFKNLGYNGCVRFTDGIPQIVAALRRLAGKA